MQKLYCYVDENGQDTKGQIFIVSVVVLGNTKDELLSVCELLEQATKKGKLKWGKAGHSRRVEYLRRIFAHPNMKKNLCFSIFRKTTDYDMATIVAIAKVIHFKKPAKAYKALIYVDGLSKTKRHVYGRELRKLGVSIQKVQGVAKDENNALTRLADAIAGFIRDVEDGNAELRQIYEEALASGILVEV